MKHERFAIKRPDGRSNAQVVLDCVAGAEPGRVFTYDELAQALGADVDRLFDVAAVRQAVISASARLLRERQQAINNVRGVGYRLALPNEHRRLALTRKRRSDVQLRWSYNIATHTDLTGLSDAERVAHENTRMVVGAVYMNQIAMEKRLQVVERAIGIIAPKKTTVAVPAVAVRAE